MSLCDDRYPLASRALHWTMAGLIPIQFALGWVAEHGVDATAGMRLLGWHYALGLLLCVLLVLRVAARAWRSPPPPAGEPRWRRRVAASVHGLLYLLLATLPITGYVLWAWTDAPMRVLGLFDMPRLFTPPADDETLRAWSWYAHVWGCWLLAALVALHVGAVLWHRFVRQDRRILRRMA